MGVIITFDPDQIDTNSSDIVVNTSDVVVASDAASDASSDAASIAGDDKFAKSVYSDPESGSFAVTEIEVTADSKILVDHSSSAEA